MHRKDCKITLPYYFKKIFEELEKQWYKEQREQELNRYKKKKV